MLLNSNFSFFTCVYTYTRTHATSTVRYADEDYSITLSLAESTFAAAATISVPTFNGIKSNGAVGADTVAGKRETFDASALTAPTYKSADGQAVLTVWVGKVAGIGGLIIANDGA